MSKRQIAGAIVSAGVQAVVYRAGANYRTEKQGREACLRQPASDNARTQERAHGAHARASRRHRLVLG
ncbi:MAG: hypothetical protein K0U76_12660 [Actinomycetia bacterium]|nr:hypothetical protein [Actinomycetes bacterium]